MDKKKILTYGGWIIGHGIAWILAYKFGFEKIIAQQYSDNIAEILVSFGLVILSIYDSYKGRVKIKGI